MTSRAAVCAISSSMAAATCPASTTPPRAKATSSAVGRAPHHQLHSRVALPRSAAPSRCRTTSTAAASAQLL
eukprot:4965688-Prymnesium_polylepis.1